MYAKQVELGVVCLFFFNVLVVVCGDTINATCKIEKNSGIAPIYGSIKLTQSGAETVLQISLEGFNTSAKPTLHGFHVHESGDLSQQCTAAGAHFNPENKAHGAPNDTERHVGDLGNIEVGTDGKANVVIKDSVISLSGKHSVLNLALVVHEFFDDLGRGGFNDSKTTGNAGRRFGCCTILADSSGNIQPTLGIFFASLAGTFLLLSSI